jgi:SAM-dependent methyltransferase
MVVSRDRLGLGPRWWAFMSDTDGPGPRLKRGWLGLSRAKPAPAMVVINEQYVASAPSRQNIANIFKGRWISGFPDASCVSGGIIPLFADSRIAWLIERCGGSLAGQHVAELGPFEGGHSYMLLAAGAASVEAIEANTLNFTKTLLVKEIFGLKGLDVRFGEIEAWLAEGDERFDLIVASGVLYHFNDPLKALWDMARRTDRIFLWTHFVDDAAMPPDDPRRASFIGTTRERTVDGVSCTYHSRSYAGAQTKAAFCGGVSQNSIWISRDAILRALTIWGFAVEEAMVDPGHANGPCACFLATRRPPDESSNSAPPG